MTTKPSVRGTLSQPRIVETALAVVDRDGLDGLTMRRLAGELGCEAMSLYKHVPDKQQLLQLLIDSVLADFHSPASADWRTDLRSIANELRRLALAHPHVFPLIAEQLPNSPTALAPVGATLSALGRSGLSEREVVGAFWALVAYTTGALVGETAAHRGVTQPFPGVLGAGGTAPDPSVARYAEELASGDWEVEFHHGLELLLTAIAARATT